MKFGDLVKWQDYTVDEFFVGVFVRFSEHLHKGDIVVLCNGSEKVWDSWQCEVISESR